MLGINAVLLATKVGEGNCCFFGVQPFSGHGSIGQRLNLTFGRCNSLARIIRNPNSPNWGIASAAPACIGGGAAGLPVGINVLRNAVGIFADVLVKHAYPLAAQPIAEAVEDTRQRAGAAANGAPVLIGSGCNNQNAADMAPLVDGVIVASSLKCDGKLFNPVDLQRVRQLRQLLN